MELVLRSLNEYDILCDPINNGIASKKMLFDLTRRHLEAKEGRYLESLSSQEREEYIKSYIPKYLKTHRSKLRKRFEYGNKEARDIIHSFIEKQDNESYFMMLQYLSTLNNHLANGSRIDTKWISTTTSFDSVYKYYKNQDIHEIAVCTAYTNGVYNPSTLVLNLSDKEKIEELKCLSKKMDVSTVKRFIEISKSEDPRAMEYARAIFHECFFEQTSAKFRGFSFANAAHEICFYNHIDYRCVRAILERLHVDLILLQRFNEQALNLSKDEQRKALIELKERMKNAVYRLNDPYLTRVFDELYLKNKSRDKIAIDEKDREKIEFCRRKILAGTIEYVPSVLIKK